ncbi:hypothetical protein [Sulfurospirillum sp. 1612]|uniref:hypothetical protein n=1 Tax=Sulfurospirillum sp. 1612 TaxID=3094835 RepID=UPI002F926E3C
MKKLLLLFVFVSLSYATNLLTHNIYDREDRVDIMLSFDSPYTGTIFQDKNAHATTLKLAHLNFDKTVEKNINSKIVQELSIRPNNGNLLITLHNQKEILVSASKTTDGFGLRIRTRLATPITDTAPITTAPITTVQAATPKADDTLQNIKPFQDSSLIDARYITVVAFLFVLLLVMMWVKKRVAKNPITLQKKSWLFKSISPESIDIKILHKKPIDPKNSLLVFEYQNKRYLVMSGNSNVVVDTFGSQDFENTSDFEQAFEDNRKKLDDYLKLQEHKLESYKDKASSDMNVPD